MSAAGALPGAARDALRIAKEMVLNQLIRVPAVRAAARRRHVTGLGADPGPIAEAFGRLAESVPLEGKSVLELGAGQSLGVARLAREHGASSVTIADVERYLDDEQVRGSGVDYVVYDGRHIPRPDASFDVVWSNDVYEHLRHPEITVRETYRLLRPGGVASHVIDLQDHFSFGRGTPHLAFDCLRYPEPVWRLMTWNRSNYVNRLRASEWVALHEAAGFRVLSERLTTADVIRERWLTDEGLRYLRRFSERDATTAAIHLVVTK